jgi:LysM repeat protein
MTTIFVSAKEINASNTNNLTKSYITIKVNLDDTLWNISKEYMNRDYYNYSTYIEEVILINNLKNTTIYAGEYITIPIIEIVH